MVAYERSREGAVEQALDGDPLAAWIRRRTPWDGTATELLEGMNAETNPDARRARGYPTNARAVNAALRRLAPDLRRLGVNIRFIKGATNARAVICAALRRLAPDLRRLGVNIRFIKGANQRTIEVSSLASGASFASALTDSQARAGRETDDVTDDANVAQVDAHVPQIARLPEASDGKTEMTQTPEGGDHGDDVARF